MNAGFLILAVLLFAGDALAAGRRDRADRSGAHESAAPAEPASSAPLVQAADDPAAAVVDADIAYADAAPPVEVLTLGDDAGKLHLLHHGEDLWSMHAEGLVTDQLFRLWREVGGPEVIAKVVIDRPYTLSVHRVQTERILARLLDGYGYTLHYDESGRLARVRVYSPEPAQPFKTPRLTESLTAWRDAVTTAGSDHANEDRGNSGE